MSTDQNLLFGILALQMDFINRDQLVAAMHSWVLAKHKALAAILEEQRALAPAHRQLLTPLVDAHIQQHGNDPKQSLAALSSVNGIRHELEKVGDADLQQSLSLAGKGRSEVVDSDLTQPPAAGELRLDAGLRFRILRPHARGGLGEVSIALDTELEREVALKEIQGRHADSPEARARFLLEGEITGKLEHPGIVPVYGLGRYSDGRPFYAMRFIKGDSLMEAIKSFHEKNVRLRQPRTATSNAKNKGASISKERYFSVDFRKLVGRFLDVCNAIAFAHSRGVLHRDLKPQNVMLGKYGETLVIDWGLAKAQVQKDLSSTLVEAPINLSSGSGSAATQMGSVLGTPAFMSPEQAAGRLDQLGPATDVYSLGATLYAILIGQAPLEQEKDVGRLLTRVQKGDITPPRQINVYVPPALEAVCLKAMALSPAHRYATPNALAEDIEHWLADEPVSAWPEPVTVRAGRWVRRNRTLASTAAAALLVAAIGLGTAALLLAEANEKERDATKLAQANERKAQESAAREQAAKLEAQHAAKAEAVARAAEKARADSEAEAKNQAAAQKQKAETARDEANRHLQTLLGVVSDIDYRKVREENKPLEAEFAVRLIQVAKQLEAQPPSDPLALANLQNRLGRTLLSLGYSQDAIPLFAAARATWTAKLGADHPDTLMSMNNLAGSYQAAGKLDLALPLLEETLKIQQAKLGADHPNTLMSMNNLAEHYRAAGKLALALPLYEETLKLQKAKLGADHPATRTSMNNLALGYQAAGKLDLALPLYEETLKLQKAKLGADHHDTLNSMNNLASGYQAAGKLALALPLYEETLKLRKAKLGADHPDTLTSMNNLAEEYRAAGKLDLALPLYEETLKLRKAKLGADHPDTLTSMNNLALGFQAAGKLDLALPLLEETLKLRKAKLGADHPDTLGSMNNLAAGYQAAGKLTLALTLFEETLKLFKVKVGADHPNTLASMNNLASGYQAAGKLDLALPLLEETLKLVKAKLGADHPNTLASMNCLALGYQAAGKLDLALPLYEETLKLRKAKLGADHPDTLGSMNNLALGYQDAGKLALALPLYEETLKLFKIKLGADHPDTLASMNNLASAYQAAGKLDLALPLYEETLKLQKAKLGADHPNTLSSMNNLASGYQDAGKLDLALPLLEETLKLVKAKLGADHPNTLLSMNNLASGYQDAGKLDLALPLYEETLKLRKAKLGADHPDTLASMNDLASGYQDAGKLDLALPLFEETLKIRKAKLGADHPDTLLSMTNLASGYQAAEKLNLALPLFMEAAEGAEKRRFQLGNANTMVNNLIDCLERLKKMDQAEVWRRKWLAVVKERSGPDSIAHASESASLGRILLEQKKWTDAEGVLRASLDIRQQKQPDDWTTFNTRSMLGGALLGQKNHNAAEPLLLKGYEGMKQRAAKIPPAGKVRLTEAVLRLINLYEATGNTDEVAKWRVELEAIKKG